MFTWNSGVSSIVSPGVSSFNARTGAVTLLSGDVTGALGYTPANNSLVVLLAGSQTITGQKVFTANTKFQNAIYIYNGVPGSFDGVITSSAITATRTYSLPDKDGTFAMLSDIPASGVTSFNARIGAVTLVSGDVNSALGYTAANDTTVVHITGNENITGVKLFNGLTVAPLSDISFEAPSGSNQTILSALTPTNPVNNIALPNNSGTIALTSDIAAAVISVNARTGAVTIISADVTGALGYTPVNKAGDTMSGALTVSSGGISITAGGLNLAANGITVANGNVSFTGTGSATPMILKQNGGTTNGVSLKFQDTGATNPATGFAGLFLGNLVLQIGTAGNAITFFDVSAERMRMLSGGLFCIGYTADPGAGNKLAVNGNAFINGNISAVLPAYSSGTNKNVVYNSTNNRFETVTGSGTGVPAIIASGVLSPGQTAGATVLTATAATLTMWRASGFVNIATLTGTSLQLSVTFTDDNGNSQGFVIAQNTITGFVQGTNFTFIALGTITITTTFVGAAINYSAGAVLEQLTF